jgi:hypothetical protein
LTFSARRWPGSCPRLCRLADPFDRLGDEVGGLGEFALRCRAWAAKRFRRRCLPRQHPGECCDVARGIAHEDDDGKPAGPGVRDADALYV